MLKNVSWQCLYFLHTLYIKTGYRYQQNTLATAGSQCNSMRMEDAFQLIMGILVGAAILRPADHFIPKSESQWPLDVPCDVSLGPQGCVERASLAAPESRFCKVLCRTRRLPLLTLNRQLSSMGNHSTESRAKFKGYDFESMIGWRQLFCHQRTEVFHPTLPVVGVIVNFPLWCLSGKEKCRVLGTHNFLVTQREKYK